MSAWAALCCTVKACVDMLGYHSYGFSYYLGLSIHVLCSKYNVYFLKTKQRKMAYRYLKSKSRILFYVNERKKKHIAYYIN